MRARGRLPRPLGKTADEVLARHRGVLDFSRGQAGELLIEALELRDGEWVAAIALACAEGVEPTDHDRWLARVLAHGKLTDGEVDDIAHALAARRGTP